MTPSSGSSTRTPSPLPIGDRPLRVAVVGLGQISELCLPPYATRDDVEVVGLCDVHGPRVARWHEVFPLARPTADFEELLSLDADIIEVLVPTPKHAEVAITALERGYHMQLQKPMAQTLADADRMIATARERGAVLRIMEDYLWWEPLRKLRELVHNGEIGAPQGMHMKIVATARGGWDVDPRSYDWQVQQSSQGLGILTFDHAWHQFAVAHWLFGPIRKVFGWVRRTPLGDFVLDTPATFVWEHDNDVRVVLELVLAPEMYFRSDFYADDERVEVTGSRGFVRCNRISGRGVQEPSVVMYRDGEMHAFHALADDPRDAFAASAGHMIDHFRTGNGALDLDGEAARSVLRSLLAGLESSDRGEPITLEE